MKRRMGRLAVAFVLIVVVSGSVGVGQLVAVPAQATVEKEPGRPRNVRVDDRFAIKSVGEGLVSPDGAWVAYTVSTTSLEENKSTSRLWMVETAGGDPIPMTAESSSASSPRWSPDGKYLSFLSSRNEGKSQVWVFDRRGGEAWQLTDVEQGVSNYEWSPDGKRLVLGIKDAKAEDDADAGSEGNAEGDSSSEESSDVPDPWVIDRLQFKQDYIGYLDRRRTHLYVFDLSSEKSSTRSSEVTQITSSDYDDSQPQWSADGTKIAFVSNRTEEPDSNYNTDIWLVDPGNSDMGKTLAQVTLNEGADSQPRWHPDSQHIAFITNNRPELSVYDQNKLAVVRVGGDNPEVLTEDLDRWVTRPRFSADGDSITFILEERGTTQVARIPTAGGAMERLIAGSVSMRSVEVGPDDSVVALVSNAHSPGELVVLDANTLASAGNGRNGGGGHHATSVRRLTRVNQELFDGLRLGEVEKVAYNSADGTEVETFIYKPPSFDPAFRYPTVLWIHGGPMSQWEWGFNFTAQWIAANGYVVVLPNPRGSTGYGLDFERAIWADWGDVDSQDVLGAVDKAIELGYSDPERLAVGGWSYGGILTNYVITSTQRFKAAMSGASGALWVANYGHDHYQRWYEVEFGLPWENRELWERLSPFNKVAEITTPTMWMGGENDWNVPIQNSEQMYQAMKRLGRETVLVVYPNQFHGVDLPVYDKDFHERVIAWYDKYLK